LIIGANVVKNIRMILFMVSFFKIQENALLDYLKTIQFESVLEYGFGFGRITKLLLENFEIKQYKVFDLSQDQIINAKNYAIIIM